MRQHLLISATVAALLLGGWGGIVAAALCPHAGSSSSGAHSCFPERKTGEHSAKDSILDASGHGQHARKAEESDESCHSPKRATEKDKTHADAAPHDTLPTKISSRGAGLCAHCAGRPANPPSSSVARESNETRRGHEQQAGTTRPLVAPRAPAFTSQITPKQGSPPGVSSRRFVALNVFRI